MGHLSEWQMLFWYDPKTKFFTKIHSDKSCLHVMLQCLYTALVRILKKKVNREEKKNVMQKLWGEVITRPEILVKMRNESPAAFRREGNEGRCHCSCGKDHAGIQTGGQ